MLGLFLNIWLFIRVLNTVIQKQHKEEKIGEIKTTKNASVNPVDHAAVSKSR